MINVRNAETKDIHVLQDMLMRIGNYHASLLPSLIKENGEKRSEMQIRDIIYDTDKIVLIAELNGDPVGFCIGSFADKPETEVSFSRRSIRVNDLYVCSEYRRQGIGGRLLAEIEAIAEKTGVDAVELTCWSVNSDAYGFYSKAGYLPEKVTFCKKTK